MSIVGLMAMQSSFNFNRFPLATLQYFKCLHKSSTLVAHGAKDGPFHDMRKRKVGDVHIVGGEVQIALVVKTSHKRKGVEVANHCSFRWARCPTCVGKSIATFLTDFYVLVCNVFKRLSFIEKLAEQYNSNIQFLQFTYSFPIHIVIRNNSVQFPMIFELQ